MRVLLTVVLFMHSLHSFACSIPPITLLQNDHDLVERSPNIVLAKVIEIKKGNKKSINKVKFETTDILRGDVPKSFSLDGYNANDFKNALGDFNKHQQPKFWAYSAGNSILPGDCNAYGLFSIGKTYLIFYDRPTHNRSFEEIKTKDDLWLSVVKLLIKQENEIKNQ